MNLFFIRTRLQCLIAQRIIKDITPGEGYYIIFMYQNSTDEDAKEVYALYNIVKSDSIRSYELVGADGIILNLYLILPIMFRVAISGGRCFVSTVDSMPIALATRFMPWVQIETFDDGAANLLPNSRYFSSAAMQGSGLKRRLARLLFPRGHVEWMRKRSHHHYTIFDNRPNIVPRGRLKSLNWDWTALLDPTDLERLNRETIQTVVLGTPHDEFPDPKASRHVAKRLAEGADLYIRHPREGAWLEGLKVQTFSSPAEAILIHLARLNSIQVYHFNSTVGYSLSGVEGIALHNLVDPKTQELHSNA